MHCFSWGAGSVISWAISWGLSYFLLWFTLPFPGVSMPHSLPSIRFLMQSRYNNIPLCWQPCSLRVHHKPGAVLGTSPTPRRQNYPHFMPEIIIPRCTLSDWWNWSGFWNRWHLSAIWQMAVMGIPWEWENLVGFPHGLSRQLQLLSIAVSLSHRNDTYISKEYESWLSSEDLPLVLSGKAKKAPELKLAEWGSGSWMKTMESSLRTALDSRTWLLLSVTKPPKQYLKQQQSFTLLLNLWVGWARPGSFLLGIFHALVFIVADTWSAQVYSLTHQAPGLEDSDNWGQKHLFFLMWSLYMVPAGWPYLGKKVPRLSIPRETSRGCLSVLT